mgnify:CR=1 FL=1
MNSYYTQDELDNHSNQLNPNNDAYWTSRGYDERPDDWDDDWDDEDFDDQGNITDDYADNCDYEDWCSDDFD